LKKKKKRHEKEPGFLHTLNRSSSQKFTLPKEIMLENVAKNNILLSSKYKRSVVLLDINLHRYNCFFFLMRNSAAGCFRRRKINPRGETPPRPHHSVNGLLQSSWQLKATATLLWDHRILSSLYEKCHYYSALGYFLS